jgi:hypothetical protein
MIAMSSAIAYNHHTTSHRCLGFGVWGWGCSMAEDFY